MEPDRQDSRGAVLIVLAFVTAAVALLLLFDLDFDIIPFLTIPAAQVELVRVALVSVIILSLVWVGLQIVGRVFDRLTVARGGSHAQARSIWKLVSYLVWAVVAVFLVIGLLGDVTSTALSIGLVGAALAFVLQKPLLNVAGWIIVTYRRLYRIGDRVALGGVRGYVTDIGLMHTELQEFGEWMKGDTFTGRIVAVPNAVIFDGPTYNYTRDFPFIWDEVGNLVTYESDVDVAKDYMVQSATEVVGELMEKNYELYRRRLGIRDLEKLLLRKPEMRMEFSDSGVNLYVVYFCPADIRRRVRSEIVERIWRRFMADPRVGIAYPHVELVPHASGNAGGPFRPGP